MSVRAVAATRTDDGPREPLDLRLLLPALVAWAALVALLPHPPVVLGGVAGVCLLGAVVALLTGVRGGPPARQGRAAGRAGARARWGRWAGVAVLSVAATGLVCAAAAVHLSQARAGPVPGWAQERAVTEAELVVTTEPRVVSRGDERPSLVVLEARVVAVQARGERSTPHTPVLVLATAGQGWEDVSWRSRVRAEGRWAPADPGERTVAVLTPRRPPAVLEDAGMVLRGVDVVRDRFRQALQPLPADARGLVPGLVIGDTSLTPPDLTEAMRATGMTHLSAVSGSNVAIIMGGVAVLLARVGTPRRWRLPLVLGSLVGFVLLCRPEPSVLRAGVMGAVGLLAVTSGRRRLSLPALGSAVLGLLVLDPWLARSYGFALSTLATLGLVLWARPWGLAMARHLPRRAGLLGYATAIPLAAQVICAPVIVLLQGSITTVAVLANLLSAPLVAPTTILGVVAACLAPLSVGVAGWVAWLAALPAWLIGRIARVCAQLPYGTLDWVDGVAGAWLLALLTVLALATGPWWRHQLTRRPWWLAVLAGGLVAWVWPVPALQGWPRPGWVIVGCDVGQGDAFVIRTGPSRAVLVDTGPDPASVSVCLRDLGVRHVDLLVLTHFHADHVGGVPGVLAATSVGRTYVSPVRDPVEVSERTLAQLEAAGVPSHEVRDGERVQIGEVVVEVVGPGQRAVVGGSAANNGSVVLDVDAAGTRILLTGDLEPEGARPVRERVRGRDYDVLKVAHHGSAAQDDPLVRGARAEVAMIGVGADNTFGHPAPSALSLLRATGALVLRTDTDGDVAVSRDAHGRLHVHRRGGERSWLQGAARQVGTETPAARSCVRSPAGVVGDTDGESLVGVERHAPVTTQLACAGAQGVQGRAHGRHALQVRGRDDLDDPARRRRHRSGDDVRVGDGAEDELGHQGHAETGRHQAEDGDVVLGLEGDVGIEAGVVGQGEQVPPAPGAARDPPVGGQVREVDLVLAGQGVVLGQREHDRVGQHVQDDQSVEVVLAAPRVVALVGEGDRQIDAPGADRRQRLGRLSLGELHGHRGVALPQPRQRTGDQGGGGGREGHEPHPSRLQARDRADLRLGLGQPVQDLRSPPRQQLPGLREPDRAPDALDQGGAGPLLQPAHHLRDGRLRIAQRLGRSGERAFLGDGSHDPQPCSVEHAPTLVRSAPAGPGAARGRGGTAY